MKQEANISENKRIEKTALMMLDDNMPMELIQKYTGLSAVKIYQIALLEAGAISNQDLQIELPPDSPFTVKEVWQRRYEQHQKAIMDYNSAMSASRRLGYEEGLLERARIMLSDNIPIDTICKHTGLSLDKIKTLKND